MQQGAIAAACICTLPWLSACRTQLAAYLATRIGGGRVLAPRRGRHDDSVAKAVPSFLPAVAEGQPAYQMRASLPPGVRPVANAAHEVWRGHEGAGLLLPGRLADPRLHEGIPCLAWAECTRICRQLWQTGDCGLAWPSGSLPRLR